MQPDVETPESSPAQPEVEVFEPVSLESLTEEQDAHWRLTGELPTAKAAEPPPAKETDAAPAEAGKPKGTQETGKGKGIKERIPQLDREIQELEARLARKADLNRQLGTETGEKTPATPAAEPKAELKPPQKPNVDDYDTWEKFENARDLYAVENTKYQIKVALQEDRIARAEEAVRQQQESEGKKAADGWNKQIADASNTHSDWNDVVGPVSELVGKDPRFQAGASFLLDSQVGAEILYHLGSNPDKAAEIAEMSPIRQVAALTRIEDSLVKPATAPKAPPGPKRHTEVPRPPTEISGRNALPHDPVKAALEADDTEAYIAAANARDLAANRGAY